jgi:hypothetical protein
MKPAGLIPFGLWNALLAAMAILTIRTIGRRIEAARP